MATKTIPQLTLRASLTDSSMFEIDDGIQSYRVTALQVATWLQTQSNLVLTAMITDANVTAIKLATDSVTNAKIAALAVTAAKLDESFIHDLTAVTPVAADYVGLADASDSNKKKKASVSLFRNAVYRAVSTTDSVGIDDETMVLSGASFTSTLPTAASVTGKRYKFIHAGTSLTQLYTLATTSSQTIGGIASGSFILSTAGESLTIESDGSNWIIVARYAQTPWSSTSTITITSSGGGVTKGNSPTTDKIRWRRVGKDAYIEMAYKNSTATGAAAGTGDYLFLLPLTADTTDISLYTTVIGSGTPLPTNILNGVATMLNTASSQGVVSLYDSTHFRIMTCGGTSGIASAGFFAMSAAAAQYLAAFRVPISGWQP